MDDITESAKAIAEVAKLGKTAIDVSAEFGHCLSNVLGTPVEDVYGIVGDQIHFIQWKNQVRMVEVINKYHEEKGFPPVRPIPPKFAIPMILNAGFEEDNDLQDIWCRLISNSMDSNFNSEIRYAYIDIIKNLTSLDAKILKYIFEKAMEKSYVAGMVFDEEHDFIGHKMHFNRKLLVRYNPDLAEIRRHIEISDEQFDIALYNLIRLQCIRNVTVEKSMHYPGEPNGSYLIEDVILTPLGIAFIEACLQ